MKRILLACTAALLLASCSKQGEIEQAPTDFIEIHGKTYKLMSIVPCKNCRAIWIMYPKDSLDRMPQSVNYNIRVGSGKTSHEENVSVIKVD